MPVGGGKPAGGYRAGKKGSYGCKGFPTVSADGTVHGCHPTKAKAAAQARAIWASTSSAKKFDTINKAIPVAGDFVMFNDDDEISVGRIEYVMDQPGTLGLDGSEYALEYSEEDKPAIVRIYEEDDGVWEETSKLMYVRLSEVVKIDSLMVAQEVVMQMSNSVPSFDGFAKDYTRAERVVDLFKRERSMATRERLAATGAAMPDGSYPIVTVEDLRNAIQAFGRTDNPQATKEHIMRRARALGRTDLIPENWK